MAGAKPSVPHQWRHAAIIVLALLTTVLGFENQKSRANVVAADDTSTIAQVVAAKQLPAVQLPEVKSIALPPIPIRNSGVKDPYLTAFHVSLYDAESGQTLYEKAADQQIPVASTTKVMTAMVAMDNYDLDEVVVTSPEAANINGSKVGLRSGEKTTVRNLLYGLLMVSGNDAATVLAEHMSQPGDTSKVARFVDKMNVLAAQLNLQNTHFMDPAGLDDGGRSTANEMAKIFNYALTHEEFRQVIGTADYNYTSPEGYPRQFKNSNRLITEEMHYDGMLGGKTGFTPDDADGGAGHCLIVAAKRNGHTVIAAIYKTHSNAAAASAEVARDALNYAFNNYSWKTVTR